MEDVEFTRGRVGEVPGDIVDGLEDEMICSLSSTSTSRRFLSV